MTLIYTIMKQYTDLLSKVLCYGVTEIKEKFVYKGYGSLYRALENSIEEKKIVFFKAHYLI